MDYRLKILTTSNGQLNMEFTPPADGSNQFYIDLLRPISVVNEGVITLKLFHKNTLELQKELIENCSKHLQSHPKLNELIRFFREIEIDEIFMVLTENFRSSKEELLAIIYLEALNSSDRPDEQKEYFELKKKQAYDIFPELMDSYDIICPDINIKSTIGERQKDKRRCRFCNRTQLDGAKFKKIAHAIPFGLGNRNLILSEECDTCNAFFGSTIEPNFIYQYDILRAFYGIKGREGSIKIKTDTFSMKNIEGTVNIESKNLSTALEENQLLSAKLGRTRSYIPEYDYKLLCKIALSLLPNSEMKYFKDTIEWIRFNKAPTTKIPIILSFMTMQTSTRVTIYKRRDEAIKLPYIIMEFNFCGLLFVYPLPMCSLDESIDINIVDNVLFTKTFSHYQHFNSSRKELDLSSPISIKVQDKLKFIKNKPEIK